MNYVFKNEEEEYRKEMIFGVFDNLQYNNNQNIIDLIEKKPTGYRENKIIAKLNYVINLYLINICNFSILFSRYYDITR